MKTLREKKGFTLVEIMIVVAIIGLLAAMAIPNLLRARINANDNAIQDDIKAFSTAMETYRAAQQPPSYALLLTTLTGANPPYIDGTFTAAAVKHGHTLNFVPAAAAPGQTYSMTAQMRASESENSYCIDQSGVIMRTVGAAGTGAATGCNGGAAVQQ